MRARSSSIPIRRASTQVSGTAQTPIAIVTAANARGPSIPSASSSRIVPGGWAEGWIGRVGESSAKRSRNVPSPSESSAGSAGRYSLPPSGSGPKTA